ncbi:ATP-binding protein [Paenibacillus sp. FSL R10-2199]|uniref:AlbA family DNA-binding domain-containing protein n=1 Tax=Paenibacillus sp. FSL R10-2199 TaxID=2975348 RepID=UPI0030F93082
MRKRELIKLIQSEENTTLEFKEIVSGLKAEDIVAFANSSQGGVIVIGVKDKVSNGGRQKGTVVGCEISDSNRLMIMNKTQNCRPPVSLKISSVDIEGKDVYVVEIPSGAYKPYCTENGMYKIRDDGRNRALFPNELLALFMQSERDKFITNFKDATENLEQQLAITRESIINETDKMLDMLKDFENSIQWSLDTIESAADSAESNSSNVEYTVDKMEDTVNDIWEILKYSLYLLPMISTKNIELENIDQQEQIAKEMTKRFMKKYDGESTDPTDQEIKNHIFFLRILFPRLSNKRIVDLWNREKVEIVSS